MQLAEPSAQIASVKGVGSVQFDARTASESDASSLRTDCNASGRIAEAAQVVVDSPGPPSIVIPTLFMVSSSSPGGSSRSLNRSNESLNHDLSGPDPVVVFEQEI